MRPVRHTRLPQGLHGAAEQSIARYTYKITLCAVFVFLCKHHWNTQLRPMQVALDVGINRTGDTWHVCLEGLKDLDTLAYGWRADAADISQFYPGARLADPARCCFNELYSIYPTCPLASHRVQLSLIFLYELPEEDMTAVHRAGQIMLDPYAPLVVDVRLPDNIQVPSVPTVASCPCLVFMVRGLS